MHILTHINKEKGVFVILKHIVFFNSKFVHSSWQSSMWLHDKGKKTLSDRLSGATRDTARISARLVYQLYHSEALWQLDCKNKCPFGLSTLS